MFDLSKIYRLGYWGLMAVLASCRFLICWIYCFMSILWFISFIHQLGKSLVEFNLTHFLWLVTPAIMTCLFGVTWWKILRNSPSANKWAIAASIANVLMVGIFVVLAPSIVHYLGPEWVFVLIGVLGLIVFLVPYRLRFSLSVSSYSLQDSAKRHDLHISV
jgi:hypothetical protein